VTNFKAVIQYDGTNYSGWQIQPNNVTIQGTIQQILHKITEEKITIHASGRTDAGVHALGQVASFKIEKVMKASSLQSALNSLLPQDIRIIHLSEAPDEFNAQYNANSKEYQYQIFSGKVLSPFLYRYFYHLSIELDIAEMKKAAKKFIGEHDFSAFKSAESTCKNYIRKVFQSDIVSNKDIIYYIVVANGFMHYMVRTMVGTLIEVGRGKIPAEQIEEIITSKNRAKAGATAPPQGLFLIKANY
jgi:tRNA pseudouridine38-40 synthase